MSFADLFSPRIVVIPGETRVVRLADVESSADALLRQRRESIAKARAAVRNPGPKRQFTEEEALERKRAGNRAYANRRYYENLEASRTASRERKRIADAAAKGKA